MSITNRKSLFLPFLAAIVLSGCAPEPSAAQPALKDVFEDAFLIGAAMNENQFSGRDPAGAGLVARQFNTITPENVLKWESVHPEPGVYDFDAADRFVQFGIENDMFIVGHTLVWHSQTPGWVFEDESGDPVDRETLVERMREHIHMVAGRYKGRIGGWDVVNEALNEDGTLRESPWHRIIGPEYVSLAFQFAHEADPDAELYYNDYSLENPAKRDGAVRLVRGLLDQGVAVHGIGTQGHFNMDWPSPALIDSAILAFADLGVNVMVTELDVDVLPSASGYRGADVARQEAMRAEIDPYTRGLPDSVSNALAERYREIFEVYSKRRDQVSRVTFWGVSDGDSWKNNWPVRGRTNYPLLFDRIHDPKAAFHAVVETAK